jgi:fatty-acyl-CoA synthase
MEGIKMAAAIGRPDPHAGEVPVAYVEVSENVWMTPEDVMQWARTHIGEKAAVPKEIVITDRIPLTAVGKVFKPALRWDAIRRVYEQELKALGDQVEGCEVTVGEDKTHGTAAAIRVKASEGADTEAIKARIHELLARYTVHFEVFFV